MRSPFVPLLAMVALAAALPTLKILERIDLKLHKRELFVSAELEPLKASFNAVDKFFVSADSNTVEPHKRELFVSADSLVVEPHKREFFVSADSQIVEPHKHEFFVSADSQTVEPHKLQVV